MYERFLQFHNLPSGAVLGHVLKHEHLTQHELANRTGILPQRINDYIVGRRRISADASLKIERALSIGIEGFFYTLQSNHDIYKALQDSSVNRNMPDLKKIKKVIFWDTEIERMDWDKNKRSIIQRVFEYGDDESIDEIIRFYGKECIRKYLHEITDTRLLERRIRNEKLHIQ